MAPDPPPPPLPLTGERTVPGVAVENYWFQRHVAAYRLAAARTRGLRVVDAGCGEGYGTAMLADAAATAVGLELLPTVVDHARRAYPEVAFEVADVCDTGLPDGAADAVVNLQVIEHLPDVGRFLGECRRILRPGGQLLVATPNRLTFTPHSEEPTNLFHVEEFTADELVARLEEVGGFTVQQVLGLHHGPRIRAVEQAVGRGLVDVVLEDPATWPAWVHAVVARTTPEDFAWRSDRAAPLDRSLDLLVVATAPEGP